MNNKVSNSFVSVINHSYVPTLYVFVFVSREAERKKRKIEKKNENMKGKYGKNEMKKKRNVVFFFFFSVVFVAFHVGTHKSVSSFLNIKDEL